MYKALPLSNEAFEHSNWQEVQQWYEELLATPLTQASIQPWLLQWSGLSELIDETVKRIKIAATQNIGDQKATQKEQRFLHDIFQPAQLYDQQLKKRLLASDLSPQGFLIPLRKIRAEVELFCEANLPLLNEEQAVSDEYMRVNGTQTVMWEGKKVDISSLRPVLFEPERSRREEAWRSISRCQLAKREQFHQLWVKGIQLRQKIAHNAGYHNYREYRWQQLFRFDYTPDDCRRFHEAVEHVIVPAASQLWKKRRERLGVPTLRPYDIWVDGQSETPPANLSDLGAVMEACSKIFGYIDPQFQAYFSTMLHEGLCDLEDRPGKANMGYNVHLEVQRRPFIFGRIQSIWDVVSTVFHEAGHAFQVFEMNHLPYIQQRQESFLPLEFAEVASTSIELLGTMYLHKAGLCSARDEARLRIQHLERFVLQLFPLAVRGDAFQHWVYENPAHAMNMEACDQQWVELSQRYLPDIDWTGLDVERRAEWQQVRHFYGWPFYYLEYAIAALGAFQVWANYQRDSHSAIRQYRDALSFGATKTVPALFEAAGTRFSFDETVLEEIVRQVLQTIADLEEK